MEGIDELADYTDEELRRIANGEDGDLGEVQPLSGRMADEPDLSGYTDEELRHIIDSGRASRREPSSKEGSFFDGVANVFRHKKLETEANYGRDLSTGETIAANLPFIGSLMDSNEARKERVEQRLWNGEFNDPLEAAKLALSIGIPKDKIWEANAAYRESGNRDSVKPAYAALVRDALASRIATRNAKGEQLGQFDLNFLQEVAGGAMGLAKVVPEMANPLTASITLGPSMMNRAANLQRGQWDVDENGNPVQVVKGDDGDTAMLKGLGGAAAERLIWMKGLPGTGKLMKAAAKNVVTRNAAQIGDMVVKSDLTDLVDTVVGLGVPEAEANKTVAEWANEHLGPKGLLKDIGSAATLHGVMRGIHYALPSRFRERKANELAAFDARKRRDIDEAITKGEQAAASAVTDADRNAHLVEVEEAKQTKAVQKRLASEDTLVAFMRNNEDLAIDIISARRRGEDVDMGELLADSVTGIDPALRKTFQSQEDANAFGDRLLLYVDDANVAARQRASREKGLRVEEAQRAEKPKGVADAEKAEYRQWLEANGLTDSPELRMVYFGEENAEAPTEQEERAGQPAGPTEEKPVEAMPTEAPKPTGSLAKTENAGSSDDALDIRVLNTRIEMLGDNPTESEVNGVREFVDTFRYSSPETASKMDEIVDKWRSRTSTSAPTPAPAEPAAPVAPDAQTEIKLKPIIRKLPALKRMVIALREGNTEAGKAIENELREAMRAGKVPTEEEIADAVAGLGEKQAEAVRKWLDGVKAANVPTRTEGAEGTGNGEQPKSQGPTTPTEPTAPTTPAEPTSAETADSIARKIHAEAKARTAAKKDTRKASAKMTTETVIGLEDSYSKYGELISRAGLRLGAQNSSLSDAAKIELSRMDADGWGDLYRDGMKWAMADKKTRGEEPPSTLAEYKAWKQRQAGTSAESPKTPVDASAPKTDNVPPKAPAAPTEAELRVQREQARAKDKSEAKQTAYKMWLHLHGKKHSASNLQSFSNAKDGEANAAYYTWLSHQDASGHNKVKPNPANRKAFDALVKYGKVDGETGKYIDTSKFEVSAKNDGGKYVIKGDMADVVADALGLKAGTIKGERVLTITEANAQKIVNRAAKSPVVDLKLEGVEPVVYKRTPPTNEYTHAKYAEETGDENVFDYLNRNEPLFVIPKGLMEYRDAHAAWKSKRPENRGPEPKMADFGVDDPMVDWIDSFLDGADRSERFALFGFNSRKGGNDDFLGNTTNPVLRNEFAKLQEQHGTEQALVMMAEKVLDINRRFGEWVSRKKTEKADRKAEDEYWDSSFEERMAAKDGADAEWDAAVGEIEAGDPAFGPTGEYLVPFSKSNLSKTKDGDIIHFDHDKHDFTRKSWDAETGVLTLVGNDNGKVRTFVIDGDANYKEITNGRDEKVGVQNSNGNANGEGAGGAAEPLKLESATPKQLAEEKRRREQREEIARRQAQSLSGDKVEQNQMLMDLGGAEGGSDLFNQVQPAAPAKPQGKLRVVKGKDGKARFEREETKDDAALVAQAIEADPLLKKIIGDKTIPDDLATKIVDAQSRYNAADAEYSRAYEAEHANGKKDRNLAKNRIAAQERRGEISDELTALKKQVVLRLKSQTPASPSDAAPAGDAANAPAFKGWRDFVAKVVKDNGGLFDANGNKEDDSSPFIDKVYFDKANNFAFKVPSKGNLRIYKPFARKSPVSGEVSYGYDIFKMKNDGTLVEGGTKYFANREEASSAWRKLIGLKKQETPSDAAFHAWAVDRDGKPLTFATKEDEARSRAMFDDLVKQGRVDGETGKWVEAKTETAAKEEKPTAAKAEPAPSAEPKPETAKVSVPKTLDELKAFVADKIAEARKVGDKSGSQKLIDDIDNFAKEQFGTPGEWNEKDVVNFAKDFIDDLNKQLRKPMFDALEYYKDKADPAKPAPSAPSTIPQDLRDRGIAALRKLGDHAADSEAQLLALRKNLVRAKRTDMVQAVDDLIAYKRATENWSAKEGGAFSGDVRLSKGPTVEEVTRDNPGILAKIAERLGRLVPGIKVRIGELSDKEKANNARARYNRKNNEVTISQGAPVDAVVHEIGGHAVRQWAEQHCPALFHKALDYAMNAPEALKKWVYENYADRRADGSFVFDGDALLDEIFAHRFAQEHGELFRQMLNEKPKVKHWWANITNAVRSVFQDAAKKNGVDLEGLRGLGAEEYIAKVAEQLAAGRELNEWTAYGKDRAYFQNGVAVGEGGDSVRYSRHDRDAAAPYDESTEDRLDPVTVYRTKDTITFEKRDNEKRGMYDSGLLGREGREASPAKMSFVEKTSYGANRIYDLFRSLNNDADSSTLAERVFAAAESLGAKFGFGDIRKVSQTENSVAAARMGRVLYDSDFFSRSDIGNQNKANKILHEAIHTITDYAISITDETHALSDVGRVNARLRDAVEDLRSVYEQSKKSVSGEYGARNVHEFVTELSNPSFREKLKQANVWTKTVNAIQKIINSVFGTKFGSVNANDAAHRALEKIIENRDQEGFDTARQFAAERNPAAEREFGERPYDERTEDETRQGRPVEAEDRPEAKRGLAGVNGDTNDARGAEGGQGNATAGGGRTFIPRASGIFPNGNGGRRGSQGEVGGDRDSAQEAFRGGDAPENDGSIRYSRRADSDLSFKDEDGKLTDKEIRDGYDRAATEAGDAFRKAEACLRIDGRGTASVLSENGGEVKGEGKVAEISKPRMVRALRERGLILADGVDQEQFARSRADGVFADGKKIAYGSEAIAYRDGDDVVKIRRADGGARKFVGETEYVKDFNFLFGNNGPYSLDGYIVGKDGNVYEVLRQKYAEFKDGSNEDAYNKVVDGLIDRFGNVSLNDDGIRIGNKTITDLGPNNLGIDTRTGKPFVRDCDIHTLNEDGSIRYSRTLHPAPTAAVSNLMDYPDVSTMSAKERAKFEANQAKKTYMRNMADRKYDVKDVLRDALVAHGMSKDDAEKWVVNNEASPYHSERVRSGMAEKDMVRVRSFINDFASDVEELGKHGLDLWDTGVHAYGVHTPARNAQKLKDHGIENGAGISDEVANAITTGGEFELNGKKKRYTAEQLEALEKTRQNIIHRGNEEFGLKYLHDAGLIDEGSMKRLGKAYGPDYVSFMDDIGENGVDYGASTSIANPLKKAKGRSSALEDNPIISTTVGWMSNIANATKNVSAEKMARFIEGDKANGIEAHPEMGEVRPMTPADKMDPSRIVFRRNIMVPETKTVEVEVTDKKTGKTKTVEKTVPVMDEHGKQKMVEKNVKMLITLYGKRGIEVAKSFTDADLQRGPGWMQNATRWWASFATQLSPTFSVRNLLKDTVEVAMNTYGTQGAGAAATFLKGQVALMPMWNKDFRNTLKEWRKTGKVTGTSQIAQDFREFIESGALIGGLGREGYGDVYNNLANTTEVKNLSEIKKLSDLGKEKHVKALSRIVDWYKDRIGAMNETIEILTRFNNFRNLKKNGKLSAGEAAIKSREFSTDFGMYGNQRWFNSVWMFSNSILGGTMRAAKTLTGGKYGRRLAVGLVATGILEEMANAVLNDDDESEKNGDESEKNITEYDRENSFRLRIGGKMVKIPAHFGPFSVLKYAGNNIYRAMTGQITAEEAAKNVGAAAVKMGSHFTGTGEHGIGKGEPSKVATLTPTIFQPFVQTALNEDYKGDKIAKEHSLGPARNTPDWRYAKATTGKGWVELSRIINNLPLTGGSDVEKGAFDVAPEKLKYLAKQIFKNFGTDAYNLAVGMPASFADFAKGGEKMDLDSVPFVRDVLKDAPDATRRYYDAVDQHAKESNALKLLKTGAEKRAYLKEHPTAGYKTTKIEDQVKKLMSLSRGDIVDKNGKVIGNREISAKMRESYERQARKVMAQYLKLLKK